MTEKEARLKIESFIWAAVAIAVFIFTNRWASALCVGFAFTAVALIVEVIKKNKL